MSDNVLDKYRPKQPVMRDAPLEPEILEDFGAFGFLRGVRERALMLELRHRDGTLNAIGYSWLDRVAFDPSDGLMLCFGRRIVTVTGMNLNAEIRPHVSLFDGIVRHRIPWLAEADRAASLDAKPGMPVIESIKIEE